MRLSDGDSNVLIEVRDARTGRLLRRQRVHNLVVLAGRDTVRDAIFGDAIVAPNRFAVGTGGVAAVASDTGLGAEVWRDTFSAKRKISAAVVFKYHLTSTLANGSVLQEAGLFEGAAGPMFARVTYLPITKTSAVRVIYVWTVSVGAT